MIWLCVVLYFIIGFVFLLVGQILNQKGYDWLEYFDLMQSEDQFEFRFVAMAIILFWPAIAAIYTIVMFIPWLIITAYKLFVGIIFGTIALFKKEKGNDGLE